MKKLSQLNAIVNCKCPRCREGDIFPAKLFSFNLQKTNENCSHCGLRYEREPGYYYVAMFVSYALNVAEIIAVGITCYVLGLGLDYDNLWYFVGFILLGVTLLAPFNYRYSRVILLHWLTPGLKYVPGSVLKKNTAQAKG